MNDLITTEEWAREWLESSHEVTAVDGLVRALLERVDNLNEDLARERTQIRVKGRELAEVRGNMQARVAAEVVARMKQASESVNRLRLAAEDLEVAIGEDWR